MQLLGRGSVGSSCAALEGSRPPTETEIRRSGEPAKASTTPSSGDLQANEAPGSDRGLVGRHQSAKPRRRQPAKKDASVRSGAQDEGPQDERSLAAAYLALPPAADCWGRLARTMEKSELQGIEPLYPPREVGKQLYPIKLDGHAATALLDGGASHSFVRKS